MDLSRRGMIGLGLAAMIPARVEAAQIMFSSSSGINSALVERARKAMAIHRRGLSSTHRMAVVDFSRASADTRFHLIDFEQGSVRSILVAHGRGSDPEHSGWLQSFSNTPGSLASSSGAYVTGDEYIGQHGRSLRLQGLDLSNSNAEERAIVIHAAWYVDETLIRDYGKLGRSEGCLAVTSQALDPLLGYLGKGTLIFADKV